MLVCSDLESGMELNGNTAEPVSSLSSSNSTQDINEALKNVHLNGNDDSDEDSFSTPFEILSEFLSALMIRDYKNALHYCKLILQYEPENITVQEFYPLIEEKIKIAAESGTDTNDYSDSSDDGCARKDTDGSTEYYSSASNEDNVEISSDYSFSSESDVEEKQDGKNGENRK